MLQYVGKGVVNIMEKFLEIYSEDEIAEAEGKIKRLEIRRKKFDRLKEKLENYFNFKIVDYIIDDILDYEPYHHTCLMINLAVANNRISLNNGLILQKGLKELFKIKNDYDPMDECIYMKNDFDFDEWYEVYSTREFIDVKSVLSKEDIKILKKLDISVENKLYTEQKFELLNVTLLKYYVADDMDKEDLKLSKPLPKDVTRDEYNKVLNKINSINEKYKL